MSQEELINENNDDRERISNDNPNIKDHYAVDMQILSAACLGFALTFLSIFHTYVDHQFQGEQLPSNSSKSCFTNDDDLKYEYLLQAYMALGTAGFMWLFGIALISYEFSLLFTANDRPTEPLRTRRSSILHWLYFLAFLGVACSFISHAVGIYMIHCNYDRIFDFYLFPAAGIFCLMIIVLLVVLLFYKELD